MKIAVVGCIHGELETVYNRIEQIQTEDGVKIDLLLICGDFQAVRNKNDLQCVAIPPKFRQLGSFHKYYFGEKKAPVLTLFIGGNHEASNYMMSLPYGGWVAPNIYYMGYSSVVNYKGLRIGGISGIYKRHHIDCGHFERLPMTEDTKRSVYHTRHLEGYRFMRVEQDVDIFLSHDWPSQIVHHGDLGRLLHFKPFFEPDIQAKRLGSPMLDNLLIHLKPRYWFSAHLHVKFEAHVNHGPNKDTNFLALDKCLPRRRYFEIVEIEPKNPSQNDDDGLYYDKEWLAVLKITNEFLSIDAHPSNKVPEFFIHPKMKIEDQMQFIEEKFANNFKIPENFQLAEPVIGMENDQDPKRLRNYVNKQTEAFCDLLGITDPMKLIVEACKPKPNPEEISLSDENDDDELEEEEKDGNGLEKNDSKRFKSNNDEELVSEDGLFVIDMKGTHN